jgi:hypothetical protein
LEDDDRVAHATVAVIDRGGRGEQRADLHPDQHGVLRAWLDLSRLAEGPLTLSVEAHDRAGLSGAQTVVVALDRTAPRLTPLGPAVAWFAPSATVLFLVSDAGAGVGSVSVRRADEPSGRAMPLAAPGVALVAFDAGATPHGAEQTWFVSACDAVGNNAELAVAARIDRVPPVAILTAVPTSVDLFPDLTVRIDDDGAGVDLEASELWVTRDDAPVEEATLVATSDPGIYRIAIALPEVGRWSIRLVPRDGAGLVGAPTDATFTFARP